MLEDKHGKPYNLVDYDAHEVTGVQIGQLGHKVWVCVDGVAVLRVRTPLVELMDNRGKEDVDTDLDEIFPKVVVETAQLFDKKSKAATATAEKLRSVPPTSDVDEHRRKLRIKEFDTRAIVFEEAREELERRFSFRVDELCDSD